IDACQREIGQLTTRINQLTQLYMANQITNAQTVELVQIVERKYFAQLELDKLNAGKPHFQLSSRALTLFLLERNRRIKQIKQQ
ncbi:unnamed protein product, partial [Rotaria sp. Silwood1]